MTDGRVWYVHRNADGGIASAHEEPQEGYAEEAVSEDATELRALLASARTIDPLAEKHAALDAKLAEVDAALADLAALRKALAAPVTAAPEKAAAPAEGIAR